MSLHFHLFILRFENDVVLNGSQTNRARDQWTERFENDVVLNGSQTLLTKPIDWIRFENDVVLNGSQTFKFADGA